MMDFSPLIPAVLEHASAAQPAECCGVIIVTRGRPRYIQCRNMAPINEFQIAPADWAQAEDEGDIIAIAHSHVYAPPAPSMADRAMCEKTGLPWLIVNWPTGAHQVVLPEGWKAPLIGREYCHGVHDCYTLVRDYYRAVCGLALPDYPHEDEWWLKGGDLYREHFEAAGFVRIGDGQCTDIRIHDGLLMQVSSPVPNHAAVVVEDGLILQHCGHRLSSRDVYGGTWRKLTTHVLRHRSLL